MHISCLHKTDFTCGPVLTDLKHGPDPLWIDVFVLVLVSAGETEECLGASVLTDRDPAGPERSVSGANDGGGTAGADEAAPEGARS